MSGSELERFEPLFDEEGPWDPLPGESVTEHQLFAAYRDMDRRDRTVKKLVETTGVPGAVLRELARRQSWGARVAEYDQHRMVMLQRQIEAEVMPMRRRHADAAEDVFAVAHAAAKLQDPARISARDIAPLLDVAARLERMSRGLSDGKTLTVTGKVELDVAAAMSPAERRELLGKIVAELESRQEIVEAEVVEGDDGDGPEGE